MSQWNNQLKNDLDWICLKSLEKAPAKRYGSAAALSEDIRRFMAGEPIVARPPSKIYKLQKYVARNRVASLAVAVAVLTFIAGIACSGYFAMQSNAARRTVESEKKDADKLVEFLAEQIEQLSSSKAGVRFTPAKRELLMSIHQRIESLDISEQSEKIFRLRSALAVSLSGLGETKLASDQFNIVIGSAKKRFGDDSPLALKYQLRLGFHLLDSGHRPQAKPLFEEIMDSKLVPSDSELALATELGLAISEIHPGQFNKTIEKMQLSLDRCMDKFGEGNEFTIRACLEVARLHRNLYQLPQALECSERVLKLARKYQGEDSFLAIMSEVELWEVKSALPTPPPVKQSIGFVSSAVEKLGRSNPKSIRMQYTLVQVLQKCQMFDKAIEVCDDAIEVCQKQLGKDHGYNAMMGYMKLKTLHRARRFEKAAAYGREIEPIMKNLLDEKSFQMVGYRTEFAGSLARAGYYEDALDMTERYLSIVIETQGEEGANASRLALVKAKSLESLERFEEASEAYRETLKYLDVAEEHHISAIAETWFDLGNSLILAGKRKEAIEELEEAEYELSKLGRKFLSKRLLALEMMQVASLEIDNNDNSIKFGMRFAKLGSGRRTRRKVDLERVHIRVAEAAAATGKMELAKESLETSRTIATENEKRNDLAAIHRELVEGLCLIKENDSKSGEQKITVALKSLRAIENEESKLHQRFSDRIRTTSGLQEPTTSKHGHPSSVRKSTISKSPVSESKKAY